MKIVLVEQDAKQVKIETIKIGKYFRNIGEDNIFRRTTQPKDDLRDFIWFVDLKTGGTHWFGCEKKVVKIKLLYPERVIEFVDA